MDGDALKVVVRDHIVQLRGVKICLHQTVLQTRHRHTCCGVGMHHTMRAFNPVVQSGMHHKTSGVDAVLRPIQHFAF